MEENEIKSRLENALGHETELLGSHRLKTKFEQSRDTPQEREVAEFLSDHVLPIVQREARLNRWWMVKPADFTNFPNPTEPGSVITLPLLLGDGAITQYMRLWLRPWSTAKGETGVIVYCQAEFAINYDGYESFGLIGTAFGNVLLNRLEALARIKSERLSSVFDMGHMTRYENSVEFWTDAWQDKRLLALDDASDAYCRFLDIMLEEPRSIEPEIIDVSETLQRYYDDDEERRELAYAYARYRQLYLYYSMKRPHFGYSMVPSF